MTSLPSNCVPHDPEKHTDDWIAQDQARSLAATVERLRAELEQARADHARALAEAEARYWALAEGLQDIVVVLDASDTVTSVAGDTMGILGYAHDELESLGPPLWQRLVHPEDLTAVQECLERVRRDETAQRLLTRARDRAEEYRWLELSVSPVAHARGGAGLQVMARDVSDRVQNERLFTSLNVAAEVVQRAAVTADSVLDSVVSQLDSLGFAAGVALLEDEGQFLRFVRLAGPGRAFGAAARLAGISPLEMRLPVDTVTALRRAVRGREVVHLTFDEPLLREALPDPVKELAQAVARLLSPLRAVVAPLVADDRVLGLLVVVGESLPGNSIRAIALFASQAAIAMRNAQLLEHIRESEQRYRGIFEATTDGLLVVDESGAILEANPAACDLVGRPHQALLGMMAEALLVDDARPQYGRFLETVMNGESAPIEAQVVGGDGEPVPVEVHGAVLTRYGSPRLLLVLHDMSEQVRAQEALVRSEKLDVLGRMAAGIAHDFNNILVSIRGYADLALLDLAGHPELVRGDVEHVLTGSGDAAEAIRRLQSLYRQADDTSDFALVHLDLLVTEALALTQPQWKDQPQSRGATINIVRDLRPTAPVLGNAGELRRVLANLIVNAVDAMPDGGRLTLATRQEDSWCCLQVSDTGGGIAPEQSQRLFEPFYTTKGGRGSGLGLTVSLNIVKRHGGSILVDGGQGHGATFTVRLPAAVAQAPVGDRVEGEAPVRIRQGRRV